MKREILLSSLIAGALMLASQAQARDPIALNSVAVKLPRSERSLPRGRGVALVNANCLACHSAGMILNQPAMSQAAWEAEVKKMRKIYGAPIEDKDIGAIARYLFAIKGAQ